MKRNMLILYHSLSLAWNWNKCRRMLENTGMTHGTLYYYSKRYAKASDRYQDSKAFLVAQGEYITAASEIQRYQKASVG